MSALAMILTAAMAVPGDGLERMSGERAREEQPLDLTGQWKAVVYWKGQVIKGEAAIVEGQWQVKGHWQVFQCGIAAP
jgi:hypothetical protein